MANEHNNQLLQKYVALMHARLADLLLEEIRLLSNDLGRAKINATIESVRAEALACDQLELRPMQVMLLGTRAHIVMTDATEEERWIEIQNLIGYFPTRDVMREVAIVWPDYGGLQ